MEAQQYVERTKNLKESFNALLSSTKTAFDSGAGFNVTGGMLIGLSAIGGAVHGVLTDFEELARRGEQGFTAARLRKIENTNDELADEFGAIETIGEELVEIHEVISGYPRGNPRFARRRPVRRRRR